MKSKINIMSLLQETEYKPADFDEHESITPTTSKGRLTIGSKQAFFETAKEKLEKFKELNQDKDYYNVVEGSFKKQEDINEFLCFQEEALTNLTSEKMFIKKYQYEDSGTSKVLRFGINASDISLVEEVRNYNEEVKKIITNDLTDQITTKVREFIISIISNEDLKNTTDALQYFETNFKETKNTKKEEKSLNKCVKLFLKTHDLGECIEYAKSLQDTEISNNDSGLENLDIISVAKSQISLANTQNHKDIAKTISHLDVEKAIIKSAVAYLQGNDNNNKIMLVDIFERNLQTTFIEDPQKTHTVVLYNTGKKILVIDPSNPQFSSHLANLGEYLEVEYSDKNKIYSPASENSDIGKFLKITYNSVTGRNYDQYRDCIDIAVKVAFVLNQSSQKFNSLKELLSSEAIGFISNNDLVNQSILEDITKDHFVTTPLKIQQISDIKIGQFFYKLSKKLKENLDSVKNPELLRENYTNFIEKIAQQKLSIKQSLEKVFSICESSCHQKIGLLEQTKSIEICNLELLGRDFQEIMESDYE